jgi:hypothetical protein
MTSNQVHFNNEDDVSENSMTCEYDAEYENDSADEQQEQEIEFTPILEN